MIVFVMSDSHDCPLEDLELAAKEAKKRKARHIIHCGDMIDEHLGTPIFDDFQIWVYLTNLNKNVPADLPPNWHLLDDNHRVVVINRARFYINHYLGLDVISGLSEVVSKIHEEHGYVAYALCGHSHHQFSSSDTGTAIVNPGAWIDKLCYAIIKTIKWDITLATKTHNFQRVEDD